MPIIKLIKLDERPLKPALALFFFQNIGARALSEIAICFRTLS